MTEIYNAAEMFNGTILPESAETAPARDARTRLREARALLDGAHGKQPESLGAVIARSGVIEKIERKVNEMAEDYTGQISIKIGPHMLNVRDKKDDELIARTGTLLSKLQELAPQIKSVVEAYNGKAEVPGVDSMDEEDVPDLPDKPVKGGRKRTIARDLDDVKCEACNGEMWDNRDSKRNPKQPDFRCKDKSCNMVAWARNGVLSWEKGLR